MLKHKNSFGKLYRLKSKKVIDGLFEKNSVINQTFLVYPIKVIVSPSIEPQSGLVKALVSVSSRRFKKAVDRNIIKRRIRECYRKNKIVSDAGINVAFIYVAQEILEYAQIEKSILKIVKRLNSPNETA